MQKLGRSLRDKLERQLLSLARERTEYLATIDGKMLDVQRQLEERETRRFGGNDVDHGRDALEDVPSDFMSGPMAYADDNPVSHVGGDGGEAFGERAARTMRLLVSLLDLVSKDQRSPRLTASAALLALGADCASMRDVAKAEHVSPEWVSQRTEAIRRQFDLPTNQHNKPAYARAKYSAHRLANPVRRTRGEKQ